LAGPERIEGGWWDGHLVQRDYFIAEDESHSLLWVFRERPGGGATRPGWFLQGRFG
jgi:protein ImuB